MKSMSVPAFERQSILSYRRVGVGVLMATLCMLSGLWNLAGPTIGWDEGWTLSVARNWVERGHYGRLLDGQLAPPGLEAAFPVTAPIALSFRLFGVGVWQGRLVGVVFLLVSLTLLYELVRRLYNRPVALGTLFVLVLTSRHPQQHPLIMGRQVLAEVPMFAYLLAGYLCFYIALTRSRWMLAPAALCWGIGLITKAQALPFWSVSLLLPLLASSIRRDWKVAGSIGIGIVGALVASRLLLLLQQIALQGHTLPVVPIYGLYDVTALVFTSFNRLLALNMTLLIGFPTLLGLGYAAWRYVRPCQLSPASARSEIVRLALLGLSGSWFGWYMLLSVGVPRYLFPATFFGSVFVAALLYDLTDQYNVLSTLRRASRLMRKPTDWQAYGAWLAIALVTLTVPITLLTLNNYYLLNTNTAPEEVATYLNTQTPPDALIETYESELHFLLNRRYHYPPDQLHVELNRRSLLHQAVTPQYDPLAANPDYLVVGEFTRVNRLYQPVIDSGAFRELRSFDGYVIYERLH